MNTFHEKVLRKMDFPKVTGQLAGFTLSELGKQTALSLKPAINPEEIEQRQQETEDAVKLERMTGGIPVARFENIYPHLKRLDIGASLNGIEIAQIGRVLTNTKQISHYFDELEEKEIELKELYRVIRQFSFPASLEKEIRKTVEENGRILEEASPMLKKIRTSIRHTEQRIREKLETMIRGKLSRYLTDTLITMRNDRYVIPVKQENRSQFGGVVHDQSSTGQTLFIEPQAVVDLNNTLRQHQMEEKAEIERILAALSAEIAPYTAQIRRNTEVLAHLDFVQAKARYAKELKAVRPRMSNEKIVQLYQARHPLIPSHEVVPNDILLGEDYLTMVITGPNTGGKTVVLKTFGLLQCMGQAGLQIPAEEESQLGIFTQLFADIGDEQSMEQNLSTFSSHMTNIVSLLDQMDENSLILLDELGAGTDPQEGAALAISILDAIAVAGSEVVVTSHYPELKAYGYNRPQTINASMEFDVDTLSPTYRLLIGIPGRSNAFEIARRLGLEETIIQTARQLMSGESQSVEEMIRDLEQKRLAAEAEQKHFHEERRKAEKLHREMDEMYRTWRAEEKDRLKKAQDKANEVIEKAQSEAEKVIEELRQKQMQGNSAPVKEHEFIEARSQLEKLKTEEERSLADNKVLRKAKAKQADRQELKPGDAVFVTTFGQKGILIEKATKKEWVVQMGSLKMKLPEKSLEKIQSEEPDEQKAVRTVRRSEAVPMQLDLRGMRFEEAMTELDQYLDAAMLAGYPKVTIIHGMGTGAIRNGVQQALKKYRFVSSFNMAPANQGGAGATEVELK